MREIAPQNHVVCAMEIAPQVYVREITPQSGEVCLREIAPRNDEVCVREKTLQSGEVFWREMIRGRSLPRRVGSSSRHSRIKKTFLELNYSNNNKYKITLYKRKYTVEQTRIDTIHRIGKSVMS